MPFYQSIGISDAMTIETITPQPAPTSERIKGLLSRGLMAPETLIPDEVREIAALVMYFLIEFQKGLAPTET